jgi:hypothetical protein
MPGPSVDGFASPGFQARQAILEQKENDEFDLEFQKAMEESFADVKRSLTNIVDEAQKEVHGAGGDLVIGDADGYGEVA